MKKKINLKNIKELIITFLTSLIIALFITHFIMVPVKVDGTSMFPNLHHNDFGLSFIIRKSLGLKRFQIVVVNADNINYKLVKRIIALPNEKVEYRNNQLFINGKKTKEPFLKSGIYTEDFTYQCKENEYFVLGDNRQVSKDSRYYGPFKKHEFLASGLFVLWPINNFGSHE